MSPKLKFVVKFLVWVHRDGFFFGGEGARTLSNEGGVVKDCIPGYKILGGVWDRNTRGPLNLVRQWPKFVLKWGACIAGP